MMIMMIMMMSMPIMSSPDGPRSCASAVFSGRGVQFRHHLPVIEQDPLEYNHLLGAASLGLHHVVQVLLETIERLKQLKRSLAVASRRIHVSHKLRAHRVHTFMSLVQALQERTGVE